MELGKSHIFTDGESIFESFLVPNQKIFLFRLTFSAQLEIINYPVPLPAVFNQV